MTPTQSERELLSSIDQRRDAIVADLCEIVKIDSVNPYSGDPPGTPTTEPAGELAAQEVVEERLKSLGATTRMFEPPTETFTRAGVIGPRERSWTNRPNVVGEWTFSGDGPTVLVMAHMDTVGVHGMDDPFSGAVRDGRVFGRGASDDKGGIVAGLAAVEAVVARGSELRGKVVLLSVVDEECNGSGAGIIACALEGIRADSAVSLDGAAGRIVYGCQGCVTAEILVRGRAGHAAYGNGVNAVEKAMTVAQEILRYGNGREAARPGRRLNIGVFHGGTLPAVIPAEARLSMNIVYGIDEAELSRDQCGTWGGRVVWDELEKVVRGVEASDKWLAEHPSELTWVKDLVPYRVAEDAPVVTGMAEAARDVMGREPELELMVAWTDSCWMSILADTPVVSFGPATEQVVHGPDEHVVVDNVMTSAKAVALYLHRTLRS